jgi:hypothetical protein
VIAVDGKTVRCSDSRRHEHGPLHLVSAWANMESFHRLLSGNSFRSYGATCGDVDKTKRIDLVFAAIISDLRPTKGT